MKTLDFTEVISIELITRLLLHSTACVSPILMPPGVAGGERWESASLPDRQLRVFGRAMR